MCAQKLAFKIDPSAASRTRETFTDGSNRVVSVQMPMAEFLANEDERMVAFVELYTMHCVDGLPPVSDALSPEKIFKTGMINRTHCLRVAQSTGSFRYAVWAQDANFDGHRNLQNMAIEDGSPFPTLTKIVQAQLSAVLVHGRAAFFEVRGLIDDHYYYFTKAILPLRSEQGEIVKCLVPFTDKLHDIPPDLREEFCARAIE